MTPKQITELAGEIDVPPWEAAVAAALVQAGRTDLAAAILDGRLSALEALRRGQTSEEA